MFSKGIIKLFAYVIAGAIALAAGAQLLSSVVSIVLAFRMGNTAPLTTVIIVTVIILFSISRVKEHSPIQLVLNILGYAVSGYLIIVTFVITLPFGLVVSFLTAVMTGVFCSFIRDPKSFQNSLQSYIPQLQFSEITRGLNRRIVPLGDGISFNLNSFQHILILSEGHLDKVIKLMRDRPLLPISVTHYEDCDVLFITDDSNQSKYERIVQLLTESGIETKVCASPLLAEAIQMIPIIDSRNGLKMEEYRITRDENTITHLLSLVPPRMTIFPSSSGLGVIVPEMEAPGLNVEQLKRGHELEILLHRNYAYLQEVEKSIESTA